MPEDYLWMDADELIAAASDQIDAMTEETFDPAVLDQYLDALDAAGDGASEWDGAAAERAFREKHADLFSPKKPELVVLGGKKRPRPHGRRLAGRIAAVAAVAALGAMLVCQAMGINVLGFFGKWGREQFWFPGTEQKGPMSSAPAVREGEYDSLARALAENGILTPMAPAWTPEGGEGFGPVSEICRVSQEAQSALFFADYRDAEGRGYTVEVIRYDSGGSFLPWALGQEGAEEYVCDGAAYYIGKGNGGVTRVDWTRETLSGTIEGDLTREEARRLVESITRPEGRRVYTAPDPAGKPYANDLPSMLEVVGLSPALAPEWLPEGFEKTEIYEASAFKQDVTMVHASYDRPEEGREFAVQFTWWEDPAVPVPPVFAGNWTEERVVEHNGTEFRFLTDGGVRLVTWLEGRVSGWIWGDLSEDEALQMVESIPRWPGEKPPREEPGYVVAERDVKSYDTVADALEDLGLDSGLAPGWVPEGFVLEEAEGEKSDFGIMIHGAWFRGDELLSFRVRYDENGGGTTVYEKDDNPVVQYVHNGLTYYIMTNGEFRTVTWKDGPLEGAFSGPITLEEAKKMVDTLTYTPEEE